MFQVLLMTLQNAPPRLDHERDKKFSKVSGGLNDVTRYKSRFLLFHLEKETVCHVRSHLKI